MSYLRVLPALLVLILFPVLILALIAGLIGLLVLTFRFTHSSGPIVVVIVAVMGLIGGLVYAIRELRSARADQVVEGPELDRQGAPQLWTMVDELARAVNTRTVDRIVVIGEVNAAVTQLRGERIMMIGYPLMLMLSRAQLRAVLAHEIGHYAGGRFAIGSFVVRAQNALAAVARNSSGVWAMLFTAYAKLYIWAARLSSRAFERAADGFSVRCAGSEPSATAFERLTVMDFLWSTLCRGYVGPYFAGGQGRAPLAEGLHRLHSTNNNEVEAAAQQSIAEAQPQWFDSHPATRDRIAWARSQSVPEPQGQQGPAHQFLPADFDRIEGELLGMPQAPLLDWESVIARGGDEHATRQVAGMLHTLMDDGVIAEPTVRQALLANRKGPVGSAFIDPDGDLAAQNAQVLYLITGWALVRAGMAWWADDWSDSMVLWSAQGEIDKERLVGDGRNEASDRLLAELEARGAALDLVPDRVVPADQDGRAGEDGLLFTITCTSGPGQRLYDVCVFGGGVMAIRTRANVFALMAGGSREDRQVERLQKRFAAGLEGVRAEKGTIWSPAEQVMELQLQDRAMSGTRVRLQVAGRAKAYTFKAGQYSAALGSLVQAPQVWHQRVTFGKERQTLAAQLAEQD